MIQVKFKNLKRSDLTQAVVLERMEAVIQKFPDLRDCKLQLTLEMANSPNHRGLDHFSVEVYIAKGRYEGIKIRKSNPNIYAALADVIDHLQEALNRFGDKVRVRQRRHARGFQPLYEPANL